MRAVTKLARDLHARHHNDDVEHITCYGCRMAANWLIQGRERGVPRAANKDDFVQALRADDLLDRDRFFGRIIQTIGHRGYFRSAQRLDTSGGIHVATATGAAVYPPYQSFHAWGP